MAAASLSTSVTLPSNLPSQVVDLSYSPPPIQEQLSTQVPDQHASVTNSSPDPPSRAAVAPVAPKVQPTSPLPSYSRAPDDHTIQSSTIEPPTTTPTTPSAFPHISRPEAHPVHDGALSRKRTTIVRQADTRRTRPRTNDAPLPIEDPVQLPTPHNSPATKNVTTLAALFENALAALPRIESRTVDLKPIVDNQRLEMVRDACRIDDVFYIITHAIFCAWGSRKQELLNLAQLNDEQMVGVALLEPILGSQRHLTKEVANLFLEFPDPSSLFATAQSFSFLDRVRSFLASFSSKFSQVRSISWSRRYPPCPQELRTWLDLPSPLIQRALYLSILRDQSPDPHYLAAAVSLFDQELASPNPSNSERHMSQIWSARFSQLNTLPAQRAAGQPGQHPYVFIGQSHVLQSQHIYPTGPSQPVMSSTQSAHLAAANGLGGPGRFLPMNQTLNQNHFNLPTATTSHPPPQSTLSPQHALISPVNAQPIPMQYRHYTQSTALPYQSSNSLLQRAPAANSVHTQSLGPVGHPGIAYPGSNSNQHLVSVPPHVRSQAPSQTQLKPQSDRFFPTDHRHILPTLAQPAPSRTAIHQVEAHSPEYLPTPDSVEKQPFRYYRYVEQIDMLPRVFDVNSELFTWKFEFPPELMANKAHKISTDGKFGLRRRHVSDGSTQFRLKCMKRQLSELSAEPTNEKPAAAPTTWPKCLSVSINGDFGVDFRRKAHYGLDLSTDVTDLLHDGPNEIKVCISFTPQEASVVYYIGLEIIRIASHEKVASMPQTIPMEQIKSSIMSALSRKHDDDEENDDLVITDPIMSIDLVDPFMSTLWVTPVRGKTCQHRECFDLEAFLLSRTSRVKGSSMTNPDQWKCPICRNDARPQNLIVDGFLVDVRKQLEVQNLLHTKAILVKEDGNWEAKSDAPPSTNTKCADHSTTEMQDTKAPSSLVKLDGATSTPQPDIIIILDDDT